MKIDFDLMLDEDGFKSTAYDLKAISIDGYEGTSLDISTRSVWAFDKIGLVAKFETGNHQNQTEYDFVNKTVLRKHKHFFPEAHKLHVEEVGDWTYSFLISEFITGFNPYESSCESIILANQLANYYKISDWSPNQYQVRANGFPIIHDTGYLCNRMSTTYSFCCSCSYSHDESMEPL
jgi:hypothetical protein